MCIQGDSGACGLRGWHEWSTGAVCRHVTATTCACSAGGASVWGPQGIWPWQGERARGDPILFAGTPYPHLTPARVALLMFLRSILTPLGSTKPVLRGHCWRTDHRSTLCRSNPCTWPLLQCGPPSSDITANERLDPPLLFLLRVEHRGGGGERGGGRHEGGSDGRAREHCASGGGARNP